jgi:glycosyltransferase involved in cell wall biosynthesis
MNAPSLLIVTRETSEDKTYGLGKSIQPIQEELQHLGWQVRYFCQHDLTDSQWSQKNRLIQIAQKLSFAKHFQHESLISALTERFFVGFLAAKEHAWHAQTHVHLHDPWLALGFLMGRHFLKINLLSFFKSHNPFQGSHSKNRMGITEHGFGAYYQAVRWDGVHIGPVAIFILRYLEKSICKKMHWVMAPTQLALEQLGLDLGVTQAPDDLPHYLSKALHNKPQAGPNSNPKHTQKHTHWSNQNLKAQLPAHWFKVPHALPSFERIDRSFARQALSLVLSEESQLILTVGRLAPLKQFDLVIRVFAELSSSHPNLHLLILGGGDANSLKTLAQDLGVLSKVHFAVAQNVDLYYSAANLYVSASLSESFGLANLESLAHHLPSVCSQVGGVPEVVQNGALLVEPLHTPILKALETLLNDPTLSIELSRQAAEHVTNWPSVQSITQTYVQIYTNPDPASFKQG